MQLWAYFNCYQLTLDHVQRFGQTRAQGALVIYQASQNRLLQVSPAAAREGVQPGMGMAQAAALCPALTIMDYCEARQLRHLRSLAHRLYALAADIVLQPPGGLAIRLDPLIRYYGGLDVVWQTLSNEMQAAGVSFHFGTAWGVEAAQVLAESGADSLLTEPASIKQALARCPLSATRLTDKQQHALQRVGVRSLAQVLAMPVSELGQRFDNTLIEYLCALRAEAFPRVQYFHPDEHFHSVAEPSYEISHAQHLEPLLSSLTDECLMFARLRNQRTRTLAFTLHFREQPPQPMLIQAASALSRLSLWQSLITLKLEQLELDAPVVKVSLAVTELEAVEEQTDDFFAHRVHVFAQKHLLSRLQTRLGSAAIAYPASGQDYRPEKLSVSHPRPAAHSHPQTLPAVCFTQPRPLNESPHIEYGPVRIQTGWWDGHPVKRDYFIGRTQDGRRLQLFRDDQQQWFVQGWYC